MISARVAAGDSSQPTNTLKGCMPVNAAAKDVGVTGAAE